jgi:hypothetical protein
MNKQKLINRRLQLISEKGFEWNCKRESLLIIMGAMFGRNLEQSKIIASGMTDIKIAKEINMHLEFEAIDIVSIDAYDYMQFNKEFADRLNVYM